MSEYERMDTSKNIGVRKHNREILEGEKEGRVICSNDQQEKYAQMRAEGFSRDRAVAEAYPDSNPEYRRQRGYELDKKPLVEMRIRQLKEDRAESARLVDPNESLVRWNELYLQASLKGNIRVMMEAQKQIDKINGADSAFAVAKLKEEGVFRGDTTEEWEKMYKKFLTDLNVGKKVKLISQEDANKVIDQE